MVSPLKNSPAILSPTNRSRYRLRARFGDRQAALLAVLIAFVGLPTATALADGHRVPMREPAWSGWTLFLDNDRLSLAERDEGYTAGLTLTRSGRLARSAPLSLHGPLDRLNRWLGWEDQPDRDTHRYHSISYGFAAFTPSDIEATDPITDDRPYACLLFTSSTQQRVRPVKRIADLSTLSLGLLGHDLCEELQNAIHEATGGPVARGWGHQISDGGEPTALWRFGQQGLLTASGAENRHEVSWSWDAQLGWVTDAGAGLSWRWGRIRSPWWSFAPHHYEYAPLGTPIFRYRPRGRDESVSEAYLWAGAMVRYRFYNTLLQGQFRSSDVELGSGQIRRPLLETWIGFTQCLNNGTEISLSIRARSPEFKGPNKSDLLWGGLWIRKYF
ncbi:MAG: hypothetical protein Kow006_30300 [Gammaproteobacteria bacterium]